MVRTYRAYTSTSDQPLHCVTTGTGCCRLLPFLAGRTRTVVALVVQKQYLVVLFVLKRYRNIRLALQSIPPVVEYVGKFTGDKSREISQELQSMLVPVNINVPVVPSKHFGKELDFSFPLTWLPLKP